MALEAIQAQAGHRSHRDDADLPASVQRVAGRRVRPGHSLIDTEMLEAVAQ